MTASILDWVKRYLKYEPETGFFTWIASPANRVRTGSRAGSKSASGYRYIYVKGKAYSEHRLAWLYTQGCWPAGHIDHKNRILDDNRLENLREATRSQNQANRVAARNSKSGVKGVHRHGRKWVAHIQRDHTQVYLGTFETSGEASAAYQSAAHSLFGEFARSA